MAFHGSLQPFFLVNMAFLVVMLAFFNFDFFWVNMAFCFASFRFFFVVVASSAFLGII